MRRNIFTPKAIVAKLELDIIVCEQCSFAAPNTVDMFVRSATDEGVVVEESAGAYIMSKFRVSRGVIVCLKVMVLCFRHIAHTCEMYQPELRRRSVRNLIK